MTHLPDGVLLTPYQRELLTILQEEAAEVIVAASKILRFGWGDTNPTTGIKNDRELALELGDLGHMVDLAMQAGLVSESTMLSGERRKRQHLEQFLQNRPYV